MRSSCAAIVDLPDAGRPVSQTVAPRVPSESQRWSRSRPLSCHVTPGECSGARPPSRTRRTMPAATVSLESSSIRMKAPVVRFSVYGSATTGAAVRSVTRAMSLSVSSSGGGPSCSVVTSSSASIDSTAARTVRVVCLSATCSPARSGCSAIQQTVASIRRPPARRVVRAADELAAADVEVVARAAR